MKKLTIWVCLLLSLKCSASSPLTLHYDSPASFFEESLVIGNGGFGASIYGGFKCDSLSLNDITFWSGEPETRGLQADHKEDLQKVRTAISNEDYRAADSLNYRMEGHFSQSYQPLGSLYIKYLDRDNAVISDFSRTLSLPEAIAYTKYKVDGSDFSTTYFATNPDSAIIIFIESPDSPFSADFSLGCQHPFDVAASSDAIVADGYAPYSARPVYSQIEGKNLLYDPDRGIHFRLRLDILDTDGNISALPDGVLRLAGATRALLSLTDATSFNGFDRDPVKEGRPYKTLADNKADKLKRYTYEDLHTRHTEDFGALFNRVKLDLGTTDSALRDLTTDRRLKLYTDSSTTDPELEAMYFQFGRYLLICSSRTPGVPANLQGLWNEQRMPPWSSNYTININLEENYWPAEVTGLGEMHRPLLLFVTNMQSSGQETAEKFYNIDNGAWCAGHNSDIWAITNPVGEGKGHPMWAAWNMGGAWLATHIYEHYLFNRNTEELSIFYPALRGAALFCLNWLTERDGELITSPSTSPENRFYTPDGYQGATLYGSTADLAIIRECLTAAAEAASVLGNDPELIERIEDTLPKLRPYQIGHKGNLCEWYYDWEDPEPTHRHQSHLIGLYPGHHITPAETPDLAAAAARTLELKGDKTTGWSTGWRINLQSRLRDAQKAYSTYRTLLTYISPDKYKGEDARRGGGTYPNLLDAHSPFQIDGNFGGTAGVAEMLIQSTPDEITLLPALPEKWADGSVKGLRTRAAVEVDIEWKNGKAVSATLTPMRDAEIALIHFDRKDRINLKKGIPQTIYFE